MHTNVNNPTILNKNAKCIIGIIFLTIATATSTLRALEVLQLNPRRKKYLQYVIMNYSITVAESHTHQHDLLIFYIWSQAMLLDSRWESYSFHHLRILSTITYLPDTEFISIKMNQLLEEYWERTYGFCVDYMFPLPNSRTITGIYFNIFTSLSKRNALALLI